jgi:hypothetical protein
MITIQRYYQYIPRLHRLSNIVCITITIPVFYLNENTSIITIGLPYLQSKKKRKGIYHYSTVWVILLLSYCLASFWGFTFWMKRSRSTFLAPASPRGETATWYLQSSRLRSGILFKLKPSKRMVGQIDSVPYLFLFLFLAHVQKMVYQSITYIIVPVPAHCTPTFYGIMDTMCVRVCVCVCPSNIYVCLTGLYVSKCGCQYFWWLPHLAIGADSAKTIQVWDHPKVLPLVMGIDHCLFDPSNIFQCLALTYGPWLSFTHFAYLVYQKSWWSHWDFNFSQVDSTRLTHQ